MAQVLSACSLVLRMVLHQYFVTGVLIAFANDTYLQTLCTIIIVFM
uniref:Uncharacterized protein n=1 Tax=Arundo donax TaxID=35708 RepID=A0A0A9API6_ARUDO